MCIIEKKRDGKEEKRDALGETHGGCLFFSPLCPRNGEREWQESGCGNWRDIYNVTNPHLLQLSKKWRLFFYLVLRSSGEQRLIDTSLLSLNWNKSDDFG
jgi:hypothetical protein